MLQQKRRFSTFVILLLLSYCAHAQNSQPDAALIYHKLQKLNTLGRVLYLAAHPDDENQRIITYFDNEVKVDAAYLSLTRGDGGQNLVGPEIRESLGIIRTQELLEARKVDGGEQFFSRAIDFGYSKSAEETLSIWDEGKILGDVVLVIRKFRPDVIITRFPPDERAGHGHHTSSAMLAKAAFEIAGDPAMYPEQLEYVQPWKPKRVFINTGRWWNRTISEDTPGVITIDVGQYNALLGSSYTEIAAESRSAHKSQGFGATGSRGEQQEYLELLAGSPAGNDALDGVDLTWNRVEGASKVQELMDEILLDFNFRTPSQSVHQLLVLRNAVSKLNDEFWKAQKIEAIDEIIKSCLGLYVEFTSTAEYATKGDKVGVQMELVNRSEIAIEFKGTKVQGANLTTEIPGTSLLQNQKQLVEAELEITGDENETQPYWLRKVSTLGTYNVTDLGLIGTPENKPVVSAAVTVAVDGEELDWDVPLVYKWNDPVNGEQMKPFTILPRLAVNIEQPVYVFSDERSKTISITVKNFSQAAVATVRPVLPEGWQSNPTSRSVELKEGEELRLNFEITPSSNQTVEEITFVAESAGQLFNKSYVSIMYDHIKTQTYLPNAMTKVVRLQVAKKGESVGYLHGAGDEVPESLQHLGYEVNDLDENEIISGDLSRYDAIVLGIRALNTVERIDYMMPSLLAYARNGGTLVLQYNTNHRLNTDNFAPYELKLSRDRVSEEDAEVRILQPNHEVLNYPNKITLSDFDNWVQERGLYFPDTWSKEYEAILSMNDKGESAKNGSLLVAKYGEGYYVYSGLSWFRELPAGVPGAYRLLANIISLGKNNESASN